MKYSKNRKLNTLLNKIEDSLKELGDEVKNYMQSFKNETDYNIVEYGNLLIYFNDIRELYHSCGYKCIDRWDNLKLWNTYKRQVGYVARNITEVK